MFSNISWGTYLTAVIFILIAWYLFIGYRYYRQDISGLVAGKRKLPLFQPLSPPTNIAESAAAAALQSPEEDRQHPAGPDLLYDEVDRLIHRMKTVVSALAANQIPKQEFLIQVRALYQEFPAVANSAFVESISELLVSECDSIGSFTLSMEEASELWNPFA